MAIVHVEDDDKNGEKIETTDAKNNKRGREEDESNTGVDSQKAKKAKRELTVEEVAFNKLLKEAQTLKKSVNDELQQAENVISEIYIFENLS